MGPSDPGSFRDPASHVVLEAGSVLRLLDDRGLANWRAIADSAFVRRAVESGRLVSSEEVPPPEGAAGALRHERVPVITYPYEWTFSMLRDAALLQLDLLSEGLADGVTIKDATPYNIQFVANAPLFIDVGSFEPYREGEPWLGYRQFCRQFLYPLLLRAWAGVPFQPWLRGDPEGPSADQMRRLLPARRRLHPAALLHVELQARAERTMRGRAVRSSLAEAGFGAELIQANVRRLRSLIESLEWEGDEGDWSGYHGCDHVGRDRSAKTAFLQQSLADIEPGVVLDLGANDGHFSLVAAGSGALAVAVDADEAVLDRLYRQVGATQTSIVPVLSELSNPSPSQGWAGVERPALFDRVGADLVLAFGLIHHLIYTASVPPGHVVDWLASFDSPVIVEFVGPEDPMVEQLTANKRADELHPARDREGFEGLVGRRFQVVRAHELEGGTRVLYDLRP
jgi:hypothetical protein